MPTYRRIDPKDKAMDKLFEMGRMADEESSTDVLGSYTGMAAGGDEPVQDADDL